MIKGMIGKKLGMTGLFSAEGSYIPVTVIQLGPCVVTQIKKVAIDGYNAIQLGFGNTKKSRVSKPLAGHCKKSGEALFSHLREFAVENPDTYNVGQEITVDMFQIGERVNVTGTTKGRGFAGVMKRHKFSGGRKTHGSNCVRIPGSIGTSAWPSRVLKGKKLPGHYGNDRHTVLSLEVVDIRPEKNLILIKGAVPGHKSALVQVKKV